MESMSIYMESGFERLYRWAQSELSGLEGVMRTGGDWAGLAFADECRLQTQDSPEIPSVLCQALEGLQDRPVLFR